MDIFSFLRGMFCEENQFLTNLGSIITIISGVSIFSVIVGVIKRVWSSLRRIYVRPDCLEKKEVTKYAHLYIKTRLKANDTMLSSRKKSYNVKKFIRKYLIKGDDQYHLIFGESGMGKTAFLINLYFIYNCRLFKKYDMYYVSLRSIEAIDQIKIFAEKNDPKKAILLLDAFDESKAASEDSSHAINELLNITKNYYKVVISCRTQFFNAVNEEPQILRLKRAVLVEDEMFVKHYICPFTDYEVLLYLLKYYKLNFRKIFRGKQVIKKSSNIMARPLLLSYIDDIVNEHEEYEYAYQIYKTLIGKWIDREVHFIQKTSEKDIAISDYINNFWQFIYDIVELMLQGAENGNIYSVSSQDLERLCSKYTIDLDIDKRSRTLLNRVGDDIFQFSHQSIFEFLLADGIRNGAVRLNDENSGISALDQYKLFIQEMYENQLLNKVVASESLIILNLVTPLLVDNIEQDVHISCVLADPFMKKIIFRLESATQLIDAITVGNLKEISEKIKSYDFSQYNLFWLSDGNFPKTVRVNAVLFYEAKVSINNRNLFGRILFDMEKARIVIETSENVHVPYWDINMFIDDMPVNVILEFVNEQSSIADNHGNKVLVLKTCCQCLDIEVSLHDLGGLMMEFFDYNTFMMPAEDIYDLAIKYKKGDGVEKSNYIAADLFYKSAIKGFDLARIDLFRQKVLRPGTIPSYISIEKQWFDAVVSELKRKSHDGDNEAALLLGFAYQDGIGVNEDYQKAFEYHSKAAAKENAAAINALGLLYSHGYGVEKNVDIAMNYYQQALEHGYYNAAVNMAFHYKNGDGINKDLAKALELFEYAAVNGHWRGQYEYAKILKDGILCNKDEKLAFKFCFKAASLGEKGAQKLLGDMYLEGIGTDTDLRKSLIWYCKAAEQEYEDAIDKIDSLRSQIERDDSFIDDKLRERIALILYREDRVSWPYDYVARKRNEYGILEDEAYKDYLKRDNTIGLTVIRN